MFKRLKNTRKKQVKPAEPKVNVVKIDAVKADTVYGKSIAEIKAEREKPTKTTTMITS